jgi:hypothetical protein
MFPKTPMLPKMYKLPNEIWMLILRVTDSASMLQLRMANQAFHNMVNHVLLKRTSMPLLSLQSQSMLLNAQYQDLLLLKTPHLDHFIEFLTNGTSGEISEVTWFVSPPDELETVCECLVRLMDPTLIHVTSLTWFEIKRIMAKREFKSWFIDLAVTVKNIQIDCIKSVENIIRLDPFITYERLRDVSMAGYRLLIKVAACLQYGNIQNELSLKLNEAEQIRALVFKMQTFREFLKVE